MYSLPRNLYNVINSYIVVIENYEIRMFISTNSFPTNVKIKLLYEVWCK